MKEKIIFLDRDGVINKNPQTEYVTSLEKFEFIPGAVEAIGRLSAAGYKIFIISNQQGVGKGLHTQKTLDEITQWMVKKIEEKGGQIAGVYYCTHLEEENCPCRKPKTGLIKKAIGITKKDLRETFFIGDTERDIKTGEAAGCKTVLVLSGKAGNSGIEKWHVRPDYIFKDLKGAVDFILTLPFYTEEKSY